MAAHYYKIIYNLLSLKNELYRIKEAKFAELINELRKHQIQRTEDDERIPSLVDLERNLGYKRAKISKLIKELNYELILSLAGDPPVIINRVVHHICIHEPTEELWHLSRKKRDDMMRYNTWLTIELPRTPSIGDTIFIRFVDELDKYYHGTVHEVQHNIYGDCQEIFIKVHPYKNYYHKWVSLKEEYERDIKPNRF